MSYFKKLENTVDRSDETESELDMDIVRNSSNEVGNDNEREHESEQIKETVSRWPKRKPPVCYGHSFPSGIVPYRLHSKRELCNSSYMNWIKTASAARLLFYYFCYVVVMFSCKKCEVEVFFGAIIFDN